MLREEGRQVGGGERGGREGEREGIGERKEGERGRERLSEII